MTPNELRRCSQYFKSLHKILDSIQKQTETIAKNSQPQKDSADSQDIRPLDILVSTLTLPVAVDDYYKSRKDDRPRCIWSWLRLVTVLCSLVVWSLMSS